MSTADQNAERSQLRVAVIGLGSIGRRHLENLSALGVTSRSVVRRPTGSNPAFAVDEKSGVAVFHRLDDAIQAGLDAAIICTPSRLHVESAMPLIRAGVRVLIEKPVTDRLSDAEQLTQAAENANADVSVAYCLRYHPAYRLARQALHGGQIGSPMYARVWYEGYLPDWHPWEDYRRSYAARADLGGGVLPTADHEIDMLNWWFGAPSQVRGSAWSTGALEMEVPDAAQGVIEYPGGVRAQFAMSLCRRDRARGFEIIGRTGSLKFRTDAPLLEAHDGKNAELLWNGQDYDLNNMYRDMLAEFLVSVSHRTPPPIPLADGLTSLQICEQVLRGK